MLKLHNIWTYVFLHSWLIARFRFLIFQLGGNLWLPKFFKILSLANLRLAINFLDIHRIASFLHIMFVSNIYTKITFKIFEFSIFWEITGPPFFKILRMSISNFYDNFPKYAQNCFIFGCNMHFNDTDIFSFFNFWFFNLGGNYGPPKFFKIISLKNLISAINFSNISRILSFFYYNIPFHHIYQIKIKVFQFSFLGEIKVPPIFQNALTCCNWFSQLSS